MIKSPQKEQLKVPGHQDYMPDLREFVNRVGKKFDLTESLINTFKLAVDEAVTNIIKHAYRDKQNHITIQAIVKRKSIVFVLIDQGPFFDPDWAKEPEFLSSVETDDRPQLGIFLLRKLVDKIEYFKTEAGNELRLTKYRQSGERRSGFKSRLAPLKILKSPYLLSLFTIIAISFSFYFYNKIAPNRVSNFLLSGKEITNKIADHLSSTRAEFLESADGAIYLNTYLQPIYEEKVWQIYSISVTNSSGKIIWSTKSAEVQIPFNRPNGATYITEGIFNYLIDDNDVYEFEKQSLPIKAGLFSGKIRVLFLKDFLNHQIKTAELRHIRDTLLFLGLAYVVTFLAYFFKRTLGKYLKRTKNQQTIQHKTEITGKSDAFIKREPDLGKSINLILKTGLPEKKSITQKSDLDPVRSTKMTVKRPEYNPLQLPAPLPLVESLKSHEAKPKIEKNDSPIEPEFTLSEFLDCLNSEAETIRTASAGFNQTEQQSDSYSSIESVPEISKIQEASPEPAQESVKAADLDFEIGDISDSLVDTIFNEFAGEEFEAFEDTILPDEPQTPDEEIEISEKSDEPVEKTEEVKTEDEDKTEAGLKPFQVPELKEPLQTEKKEPPIEKNRETEADSILVESIEDLFSKIKNVQNLVSRKDEEAERPSSKPETDLKVNEEPVNIELQSDVISEKKDTEIANRRAGESKIDLEPEVDKLAEKAETFLQAGVTHYRAKQYEDAIIAFRNLLVIRPDSKSIYLLLGNAYFKNNMMTEAISVYEQYKIKYPGESIAHENLAMIYQKKGSHRLALQEWNSALKLTKGRVDIQRKIEHAEEALEGETENGNQANQNPRRETKQDMQKRTLLKEGISHYRNKDFNAAINSFKVAIKLFPRFKEAYSFLGITYFRYKMFDESEQTFEALKQLQFDSQSEYENMGLIYAKQGSYQQAIEEWKKALIESPHRTDIKEKINKVIELL